MFYTDVQDCCMLYGVLACWTGSAHCMHVCLRSKEALTNARRRTTA